jgi:hypothetical protein
MKTCDVAIAYRIYPEVAESAKGLPFSDDKLRLSEMCLKSFRESLSGLQVKLWAILDGCPPEYVQLFTEYFDQDDLVTVELKGAGNSATFLKQIEILLGQQESEVVYFAEDDYFYLPNQFRSMIDFLLENKDVDFVSPYDHLDCYTMDLHREPKWLRVYAGSHWRTAASTCLTFLTRKRTLAQSRAALQAYKRRSLDCSVWLSLTKHRIFNPLFFTKHLVEDRFFAKIILKSWLYCWPQILFGKRWKLWIPVPGIATHLDINALSPNVDWRALMQESARQSVIEIPMENRS